MNQDNTEELNKVKDPQMEDKDTTERSDSCEPVDEARRSFLQTLAIAGGCACAAFAGYKVVQVMGPAQDALAGSTTEVDISNLKPGESIKVVYRKQPVFIKYRTDQEMKEVNNVILDELRDPQKDSQRTNPRNKNIIVVVGVCTHLGCIPIEVKEGDPNGEFGGWFCPCHGSHYDPSGRIRKGPAPLNLHVPPYKFLSDTKIEIGSDDSIKTPPISPDPNAKNLELL